MAEINEAISFKAIENQAAGKKQDNESSGQDNDGPDQPRSPRNKGQLIIDATCAPADITFPTDLKIINKAREKTEAIIDTLHEPFKGNQKKPRTYRKKARKEFL